MHTTIKKISSILFLLLGCIPVLLVLAFDFKQEQVREHMKERLAAQHLQKVIISQDEVHWNDDHEIWLQDRLFDVHDFTLNKGTYTFNGLFDDEETELIHQKEESDETNNEEISLLEDMLDLIQSPYYTKNHELFVGLADAAHFISYNNLSIISPSTKVLTPPPQRILHLPV